jgi:hypothetical protein
MKCWQILGFGEGFLRADKVVGFELSGFVFADTLDESFARAISLAKLDHPELAQADKIDFPRPVINAEEIYDVTGRLNVDEEGVEVIWDDQLRS